VKVKLIGKEICVINILILNSSLQILETYITNNSVLIIAYITEENIEIKAQKNDLRKKFYLSV